VACGMAVTLGSNGVVQKARFAYGGVAKTPIRLFEAEESVEGRTLGAAAIRKAQDAVRSLQPISDHRGSADYRLAIAKSLLDKFAYEAGKEAA